MPDQRSCKEKKNESLFSFSFNLARCEFYCEIFFYFYLAFCVCWNVLADLRAYRGAWHS